MDATGAGLGFDTIEEVPGRIGTVTSPPAGAALVGAVVLWAVVL